MEARFDITTVGMININVAISPVGPDIFTRDVTMIDPVETTVGGDAANEAVTAAYLGNKVAIVGKIGEDLFGRRIMERLKAHGVDESYIRVAPETSTAVGLMFIGPDGNRNICANRGALETLCLRDIDFYPIEHTAIVNIGSLMALKELDGAGVCEVLRRAKAHGALTSADAKQDVYGVGLAGIRPCLAYLDYFLPSYDEALYLSGEKDIARQADFFFKQGCANVLIKAGRDGCFLGERNGTGKMIPSCPGTALDTSGAGDNFVAGFLTGLRRGMDNREAARFANAVAAISIQAYGSNGAVKSFEQVMEYRLKQNY